MKKYHGVEISFKCYTKLSTKENHWKKFKSTKYCHSLGNKNNCKNLIGTVYSEIRFKVMQGKIFFLWG